MALLDLHLHSWLNTWLQWIGQDNCKTRQDTFKFLDSVPLILDIWLQVAPVSMLATGWYRQIRGAKSCTINEKAMSHTVYPNQYAHGFVVLCFVVVMQSFIMNSQEVFIHIHQGCFAGTVAIVRLPQCQWSKPDGYGKISQCITTTKHSKAKTACIFLGIYCSDNCCDYHPGNISTLSTPRNSVEAQALLDGYPIIILVPLNRCKYWVLWHQPLQITTNELQWLDIKTGYQESSSNNSHQVTCPISMDGVIHRLIDLSFRWRSLQTKWQAFT